MPNANKTLYFVVMLPYKIFKLSFYGLIRKLTVVDVFFYHFNVKVQI